MAFLLRKKRSDIPEKDGNRKQKSRVLRDDCRQAEKEGLSKRTDDSSKPAKFPPNATVRLEVETLTPVPLVNKLSGVAVLRDVEYECGKLMFSVLSKDCRKIIALLDELCYNYKIKWIKGAFVYLFSVLRRAGIIVGTAICLTAFIAYSFLIVEIEGDYSSDVGDILSSHGIVEGRLVPAFDEEAVAREVLSLDGVSFASIERVGTRVRVHVRYEQEEKPLVTLGGEVKATSSSTVTRIIVFGGTAEVEVGDSVSVGDVIIGGYYLVGDEKVPTTPSGEVYGRKTTTKTFFFADTYIESENGREKSYVRLSMFGGKVKIPTSPYENYVVHYERKKNDFLIPFVVNRWTYTEIIFIEKKNVLTEEEMKDKAFSSLVDELVGGKILSREEKIERTDGGYAVTATVVTEERIDI